MTKDPKPRWNEKDLEKLIISKSDKHDIDALIEEIDLEDDTEKFEKFKKRKIKKKKGGL